jgi:hypothetical protein
MNSYSPKYKINTSSSFLSRARCKKCAGNPAHYFFIKNALLCRSPRQYIAMFDWVKKYVSRLCEDYYLMTSPSMYNSISKFSYPLNYKGYKCKLHKNLKTLPNNLYTDFLSCSCGATVWAFSQISAAKRPEIFNRKSRILISK